TCALPISSSSSAAARWRSRSADHSPLQSCPELACSAIATSALVVPAIAETTTTHTSAPSSTSGASDRMRAASATLLPPNLWTRVTASGRSAASADEAAEATASPVSWDADDMLWKLRVGLRVRSRWKPCGPHPVRVRSGVVDQSCTRARTPAPIMVPVVVIIVAAATARVQDASAGRAQMAWVFGMGRHEYRTMTRCVKLRRLACNRNYRRDAPTLGAGTT